MITGLYRAILQLGDRRIRGVIWRSVIICAVLLISLVSVVQYALAGLTVFGIGWVDSAIRFLSGVGVFLIGLALFPACAGLVLSFMFDDIAEAVERRHYPFLPPPRAETLREMLPVALRFCAMTFVLNGLLFLVIIPVLLLSVVFSPLVPVLVYGVNGYLVGREYFELAAARRLDPKSARLLRKRHQSRIFVAGMLIVGLMTVPVLNWLMVIVGAAYMVHVVEDLRSRSGTGDSEDS